jgi:glycyl-tRNA synthetase beta chain
MSKQASFLVELGTEELPPKALLTLQDAFLDGVSRGLREAELGFGKTHAFATPRRLAIHIETLELSQPVRKIESRGPPVDRAFDADGEPTRAAVAFAEKCGVALDALERLKTDKGEWLFYSGEQPGQPAAALLPGIVDAALNQLPIPKRMRWGASDVEFVRPVHWLVMLLNKDIVPATILGLSAGRETFGHRFHAPAALIIKHADDYESLLLKKGHVIADFAARRETIVELATNATEAGEVVLETAVVDEVTALVEWPVPVSGSFPAEYLKLPPEVLTSTLQDHQKYFPVRKDGELTNLFVAMANLDSTQPDEVRRGNERVVLPRLADAAFFWAQDSKTSLAERYENLSAVVYQQGLGSLQDKADRVVTLTASLATATGADIEKTQRAAQLAKTDLLTDMVGEFPDLQGRMGYYYALHDGEDDEVATAIEEQYLPRHANDRLPATATGNAVSLAEKLDTLAGIFALGKKPSGNKDPFGLRRQALGLVRIAISNAIDLNLPALLRQAIELQPCEVDTKELTGQLYEFVLDRARAWYLDGQSGVAANAELFQAVRARRPESLLDLHHRIEALAGFARLDAATSLAAANKRIANILKSADEELAGEINAELFEEDAERDLYSAVNTLLAEHESDLAKGDYSSALKRLAGLREPVDRFFDQVMVMTDDPGQRSNRLLLLNQLHLMFLDIADISALPAST